jgi:predicted PurR-regulated permease PerM
MAESREELRTRALIILATLAIIGALYLGGDFLVPIALGIVLNALFRPIVRFLKRLHVPSSIGAAIVVLGLMAAIIGAGFALVSPVKAWFATAPEKLSAAEKKLSRLRAPLKKISDVAEKVESAAKGPSSAPTSQPANVVAESPAPVMPAMAARVLGSTTQIIGDATEVLVLVYLLLAADRLFLQKLIKVLPEWQDKKMADEVVHEAESVVLRFLSVAAMINAGQGIIIALIMWMIGMPTPILWGVFTFVLEFIPYLGAMCMMLALGITAMATFDSIGRVLLAPGSYLIVATIQTSLISPHAYGHRLKLNAVAVLLGVLFWWFVWGVPGAFLAVPIIAMLKVIFERLDRFKGVAEFLGE